MRNGEHHYQARLIWDGNRGEGTKTYANYGREYRVVVDSKPELQGSADPVFRGDATRWNPEDLFLASISSCHLLTYLALCARSGVQVLEYEDRAEGLMKEDGKGGGRFEEVVLRPRVVVAGADQVDRALELHARAHELCFIANSCSVPIHHQAEVRSGAG